MSQKLKINFCSFRKQSKWADIYRGEVPDVDEIHDKFFDGIDVWIIQSYLIFKAAKLPFEIVFSDEIKADAVNVLHRDEIHLKRNLHKGFIVGIRADRPPLYMADLIVCQNRFFARKPNALYLPHWPQPGLIPRNSKREDTLENIAFFGRFVNFDARISGLDLKTVLNQRGLQLVQDEKKWHDYREVDAAIGLRRIPEIEISTKPASKLTNAWLAGVPALLGDEPAYAELRENEYDYLVVASPKDILNALEKLQQKGEYKKFREQAQRRAQEFTREKILWIWLAVFEKIIIPAYFNALPLARTRKIQMFLRGARQHAETKIWKNRWHQQQNQMDRLQ
jgi:hypothetical protein